MRNIGLRVLIFILLSIIISCKNGNNSKFSTWPTRSDFETNDPEFLRWLDAELNPRLYDIDSITKALIESDQERIKFQRAELLPTILREADSDAINAILLGYELGITEDLLRNWDISDSNCFLYYLDEKKEYINCIYIFNSVYYLNDDIPTVLENITRNNDDIFYVGDDEYFIDSNKILTKKSERRD